jgi:hypothetical protein
VRRLIVLVLNIIVVVGVVIVIGGEGVVATLLLGAPVRTTRRVGFSSLEPSSLMEELC